MAKASQVVLSENEFYLIKAPNGKVLEVKNFNTENGAAIRLWDYAGHPWQQWKFVDAGEGRWRIQNRFTGKMMDLALGGVVAELVLGAPGKRTAFRRVAAFVSFVVCFWAGHVSLIYLTGQAYVDMVVASGMTAEYGQQLVDFMYGPLALVALAAAVAGPIVGGLLGERVFKKHFARMGA